MEKDAFNVNYMMIETEKATFTKEVQVLVQIPSKQNLKRLQRIWKNYIRHKSIKIMMYDNNKLKTKNQYLSRNSKCN